MPFLPYSAEPRRTCSTNRQLPGTHTDKCADDRRENVPSNDRHTQKRADAAEYQRRNASCREAGRQGRNGSVLIFQIEKVDGVARGVTGDGDTARFAGVEVIFRNRQGLLQFQGRLDEGCCEAGD